jgi:HEAT repeat protein
MDVKTLLAELSADDDGRAEAAVQQLVALEAQAVPIIRELLEAEAPDVRWWAVRALAELPGPETTELLLQALQDPDEGVRSGAALALRHHPDPQAIPALLNMLATKEAFVRRMAADALVATGAEAVPGLLEVMQNGMPQARLEAVRALALIGDTRAIPHLMAIFNEDSALAEYWADLGLERMGVGTVYFKP